MDHRRARMGRQVISAPQMGRCLVLAVLLCLLTGGLASEAQSGSPRPAGPAADAGWSSYPIFGGKTLSVVVHPQNAGVFYAGTEHAGVFKSVDSGATWTPSRTGLAPQPIVVLRIDPVNTGVL